MNVKKTNNMKATGITMLVYGKPGTGKTTLAGTLPPEETLLINIEGGTGVLSDKPIDMVEIDKNLGNLELILEQLDAGTKYKHIFFDSATELEMAMLVYLGSQGKLHGVPEMQHYQRVQFGIRRILRRLRDLKDRGINVIVTAHEMDIDTQLENGQTITKTIPALSKRVVFEVCGLFDIVAHLEISSKEGHEGERGLRLDPTPEIEAKNRYAHKWTDESKGRWFLLPKGENNLEKMFAIINQNPAQSGEGE